MKLVSPLNWFTVVNALLRASSPVGLSAFLPPSERIHTPFNAHSPPIPIPESALVLLPLTENWRTTDFTLRSCLGTWSAVHVREWVLRAIARYKYVIGTLFPFHTSRASYQVPARGDSSRIFTNENQPSNKSGSKAATDRYCTARRER